jgi:cell division protein FtsB
MQMSKKQKIKAGVIALGLFVFLIVIVFSHNGFADLMELRRTSARWSDANHKLRVENKELMRQVDRLKTDVTYIEEIARRELGMIGRDEMIIKFKEDR